MGCHTLEGNPPIEVTLRRSARAKRLSLRISRLDGRVTLTMPHHAGEREGIAFVRAREDWLRKHLGDMIPIQPIVIGGVVAIAGQDIPIIAGQSRRAILRDGQLHVPSQAAGPAVKAYLRLQARDVLAGATDYYAAQLGQSYSRLSIRDTRSRWGSCSSAGVIMYSWRLIMAPPDVLRYVAAHEVAHLVEMNHSANFWAIVERLYPDYIHQRQWLRDHGDRLHRVSFSD